MSVAKLARERKRQLGQFMTPAPVARSLVADLDLSETTRILEPSFGDGAFLLPLLERFYDLHAGSPRSRLERILTTNVYGVELDPTLFVRGLEAIETRFGPLPRVHNLHRGDFFAWFPGVAPGVPRPHEYTRKPRQFFDHIVGNPPFGGSIDPRWQDDLDAVFGTRDGENIKKETYSFFLVKSVDLLKDGGRIRFICSDTFLTINTMRGLRRFLMENGEPRVRTLDRFSDETSHPMVVVDYLRTGRATDRVHVDGTSLPRADIEKTRNLSWRITPAYARYFGGPVLGDYVVATGGMTTGRNDLFVREIVDGAVTEPYRFAFFEDPITVEKERARARLGVLSRAQRARVEQAEKEGATRRNVRVEPRARPRVIRLPHPDYCYYNKAVGDVIYAPPRHAIYWKDEGDAVLTFKRNGNWYLHGVGGKPFFKRSGLTWQLIAPRMHTRFLPAGYILDSGAPCAFLRDGVGEDELFFIMGWTLTRLANRILKDVINHTRNIQGKDVERLPYPFWVPAKVKAKVVRSVRHMVEQAMAGRRFVWDSPEIVALDQDFADAEVDPRATPKGLVRATVRLPY